MFVNSIYKRYFDARSYLFHFVFLERKSSLTFDVNRNHNHIKQTPLELFEFVFVFIFGYLATSNTWEWLLLPVRNELINIQKAISGFIHSEEKKHDDSQAGSE